MYIAFYTISTKIYGLHWWFYYLEMFLLAGTLFTLYYSQCGGYLVYGYAGAYLVTEDRNFAVKLVISEAMSLVFSVLYLWILMPVAFF